MRECYTCKELLDVNIFPVDKWGRRRSRCYTCTAKMLATRTARMESKCPDCGSSRDQRRVRCMKCHLAFRKSKSRGWVTKKGYCLVSDRGHPNSYKNGQVLKHVHVMSQHLGRALLPGESVHHRNGVRSDNRIENLELWSTSQPSGQRVEDKVAWAVELLRLYRPEILKEDECEH